MGPKVKKKTGEEEQCLCPLVFSWKSRNSAKRWPLSARGRLLAENTMDNIKRRLTNTIHMEVKLSQNAESLSPSLSELPFVKGFAIEENKLEIHLRTERDYRLDLSRFLYEKCFHVLAMKTKEMSLGEAFIAQQHVSLLAQGERNT